MRVPSAPPALSPTMLDPLVWMKGLPLPWSAGSTASMTSRLSEFAALITASARCAASASRLRSASSPRSGTTPRSRSADSPAALRTSPVTSWPAARSRAATVPPIYPVAPVRKTFISVAPQSGSPVTDTRAIRAGIRRYPAPSLDRHLRLADKTDHRRRQDHQELDEKAYCRDDEAGLGPVNPADERPDRRAHWSGAGRHDADGGDSAKEFLRGYEVAQRGGADHPEDRADAEQEEAQSGEQRGGYPDGENHDDRRGQPGDRTDGDDRPERQHAGNPRGEERARHPADTLSR